jgi:hypothetical protein
MFIFIEDNVTTWNTQNLWYLRFPQRQQWRLHSSGICFRVVWYMVSDVSNEPAAINFREDDSSTFHTEGADSSETLATIYETTRRHIKFKY